MFATEGRVPKAPGPYAFEWYDTPNRRFPSIQDVLDLCDKMNVTVEDARYYDDSKGIRIEASDDPNLKADTAVLILRRH
jgi:homoserine O-acetyltransferase